MQNDFEILKSNKDSLMDISWFLGTIYANLRAMGPLTVEELERLPIWYQHGFNLVREPFNGEYVIEKFQADPKLTNKNISIHIKIKCSLYNESISTFYINGIELPFSYCVAIFEP